MRRRSTENATCGKWHCCFPIIHFVVSACRSIWNLCRSKSAAFPLWFHGGNGYWHSHGDHCFFWQHYTWCSDGFTEPGTKCVQTCAGTKHPQPSLQNVPALEPCIKFAESCVNVFIASSLWSIMNTSMLIFLLMRKHLQLDTERVGLYWIRFRTTRVQNASFIELHFWMQVPRFTDLQASFDK